MKKKKFEVTHLEQFKSSGLSLSEYCRKNGICTSTIGYHLAKQRDPKKVTDHGFVRVPLAGNDWCTLKIGTEGLRIRINVDFKF